MTTREKLALHREIKLENDKRIAAHIAAEAEREAKRQAEFEVRGIHTAIECHAKAAHESLTDLAEYHSVPLAELIELFVTALYAKGTAR